MPKGGQPLWRSQVGDSFGVATLAPRPRPTHGRTAGRGGKGALAGWPRVATGQHLAPCCPGGKAAPGLSGLPARPGPGKRMGAGRVAPFAGRPVGLWPPWRGVTA